MHRLLHWWEERFGQDGTAFGGPRFGFVRRQLTTALVAEVLVLLVVSGLVLLLERSC